MLTFIVQMCGSLPSSNSLSQHRIFLLQNSNLIEGIQLSQPEAYEQDSTYVYRVKILALGRL